jgi:hypothetical protein
VRSLTPRRDALHHQWVDVSSAWKALKLDPQSRRQIVRDIEAALVDVADRCVLRTVLFEIERGAYSSSIARIERQEDVGAALVPLLTGVTP